MPVWTEDNIPSEYENEDTPWLYLIRAIIVQAKKDYVANPDMREGIERFYMSEYFTALTGVNGREAIPHLRSLVKCRKTS